METRSKGAQRVQRALKVLSFVMITAVLTMVWGCSSDDDGNNNYTFATSEEQPVWEVNMVSNQPQPQWENPDRNLFESSMYVLVKLQKELVKYSTDDDLMACFLNDECRSIVAHRSVQESDGSINFVLKILGNANERETKFALKYYSGGLHQIFTIEGNQVFVPERTYGIEQDLIPPLLNGSSKYPVQMEMKIDLTSLPFEQDAADLIGAFVGNECRGVCHPGESLRVFGQQKGEVIEIRYYSTKAKGIYTFTKKTSLRADIFLFQASF